VTARAQSAARRRSPAGPLLVVCVWAAALAASLAVAPGLRDAAVTDPLEFFPADSPTRRAADAVGALFPDARAASQLVVVLESDANIAEHADRIAALAARLRAALPPGSGGAVLAPSDDPVLARRLVATDGRAALVVVRLPFGFASEEANALVAALERVLADERPAPGAAGLRASLSGDATLGRDTVAAIEEGARRSLLVTVGLVALILLAVHRSPVAALVSLASLAVALAVATGCVTLAARLGLPVAFQSRAFLAALVYGVGTDYGLLLFARLREELAREGGGDALDRARRRVAPVLVTSAAAVILACALMGLADFGLWSDSGPALAIGVAVALAAVLTLTPALVRLAGGWLFWPGSRPSPQPSRPWAAIARAGVARPTLVLAAFLLPLLPFLVLARGLVPSFELELDIPERSASEAGWAALVRHFDPRQVSPLTLVVESPADAASLRAADGLDALYRLTQVLHARPGVARVWSATRPLGEGEPLAAATLGAQLARLREGLGRAGAGAGELTLGLAAARREVARGRGALAAREAEVAAEQAGSLLGAFAPGRFEAARRELAALDAELGELEAGVQRGGLGADALREGIAAGEARLRELESAPGAERLLDRLALLPGDLAGRPELARALDHYVRRDGRAARFELELEAAPSSSEAVALVEDLARRTPALLEGLGRPDTLVWLEGATAITADLARLVRADRARLDLWILTGIFVLLVLLLRDLAAPLAITAFILASYFAALGALRALADAGLWAGVDWKVPFFLFVLLVAIGADYGIFVLGRAREEARSLPFDAAIARAVEATGPVVSSCGLVLAGTFAALAVSRVAFLEQVGIGITIGVLVDTLVVRPFLLPATAVLLHRLRGAPA
jgi:RND superfamily putative drug exporter